MPHQGPTIAALAAIVGPSTLRRRTQNIPGGWLEDALAHLELVALLVADYNEALAFFVGKLGFDLVEDSPATTNDGRPKRWVVVRPPGGTTGILLAQADGEKQQARVGDQAAGRVTFFLRVDDFAAAYERMVNAGVDFLTTPRTEPYGRVAVFRDISGNKWDLLGPRESTG
jgi:catechol 2,3-dioxygenase-like lactoylglutathione lyase family enzyme